MDFEEPPLVERQELPKEMQPQNRFLGKMRSYVNGMSPYPHTTIELKEEDRINLDYANSTEIKKKDINEILNPNATNIVEVNLEHK